MNRKEHLLTILAEEGGEVAKEISKSLRFGLEDQLTMDPTGPRGSEGPTNREKVTQEFVDMLGAYQLAVRDGLLPDIGLTNLPQTILDQMETKARKIEAFLIYSQRVGTLQTYHTEDAS
jgi:hypothetical protein